MPSPERSPRPWRVDESIGGWKSCISDANGNAVASCWGGGPTEQQEKAEAIAALIVAAVNEYAELGERYNRLLSAMKAIEDLCKVLDRTDLWEAREEWLDDAIYYIREEARAAIKENEE